MIPRTYVLLNLLCTAALAMQACGNGAATPSALVGGGHSNGAASGAADKTLSAAGSEGTAAPLSETQAVALAISDVAQDPRAQEARYFSLSHAQAAVSSPEGRLQVRQAVVKLINSLSASSNVVAPVAVAGSSSLLKIHLSDYGWTPQTWETLAADHPEVADATVQGVSGLKARLQTRKPVLRGEWFVQNASQPPLYYQLLGLPAAYLDLQVMLRVNLAQDIATQKVLRAGFNNSSVSTNDRVVERHAAPFGVVWQSYEFGTKAGNQDILNFPLGPGGSKASSSSVTGVFGGLLGGASTSALAFAADGNELIFSLPNGLLGFYIADAAGKRLDKVPGIPETKAQITPGSACMSCHGGGFINAVDQVRAAAATSSKLASARAQIEQLYPDQATISEQIKADSSVVQAKLKALSVATDQSEPISATIALKIPE